MGNDWGRHMQAHNLFNLLCIYLDFGLGFIVIFYWNYTPILLELYTLYLYFLWYCDTGYCDSDSVSFYKPLQGIYDLSWTDTLDGFLYSYTLTLQITLVFKMCNLHILLDICGHCRSVNFQSLERVTLFKEDLPACFIM